MKLLIGLEHERFCFKDGKVAVVPDRIPADSCGWLTEARGEPFYDVAEALHSVMCANFKIDKLLPKEYELKNVPLAVVDKRVKIAANRVYAKGLVAFHNYLGHELHRYSAKESCAGIHVSFTNPTTIRWSSEKEKYEQTVNSAFDFIKIFVGLDKAFKDEIRVAKRNPGFYEFKSDGRVEYRSLPNDVSYDKLYDVLTRLLDK